MSDWTDPPTAPLETVEWRVDGKPVERGNGFVSRFVPYLDAAGVAHLLDQWVPGRWQDHYEDGTINGNYVLWCHLSIKVDGEWLTRKDVGRPSNFEGEKGAVSDAFKRAACLKWGVGRNVYELPTLWAPCRTFTTKGGVQAAPNDQTLPAILAELKRQGYSVDGGRVEQAPPEGVDPETGEVDAPVGIPAGKGARHCSLCYVAIVGPVEPDGAGGYRHKGGCPAGEEAA